MSKVLTLQWSGRDSDIIREAANLDGIHAEQLVARAIEYYLMTQTQIDIYGGNRRI